MFAEAIVGTAAVMVVNLLFKHGKMPKTTSPTENDEEN